jgi:uncharacterized protein (DUF433 family)
MRKRSKTKKAAIHCDAGILGGMPVFRGTRVREMLRMVRGISAEASLQASATTPAQSPAAALKAGPT